MPFVRICFSLITVCLALPLMAEEPDTYQIQDPRARFIKTESGTAEQACSDCSAGQAPMGLTPGFRDMRKISSKAEEAPASYVAYPDKLRKIIETGKCTGTDLKCSRGMVQVPLLGRGNIGPCGSHHYTPDPPPGTDAYAEPVANCAFTAVLQEWKKNHCPERSGCTIAWGDISHKTKAIFNGHADHQEGECIDIRPLRKGEFVDGGIRWLDRGYDRNKTKELITMMKQMGANVVLFNDVSAGGQRLAGHNNHIHVCFKKNPTTEKLCQNLKVDGKICPELQ